MLFSIGMPYETGSCIAFLDLWETQGKLVVDIYKTRKKVQDYWYANIFALFRCDIISSANSCPVNKSAIPQKPTHHDFEDTLENIDFFRKFGTFWIFSGSVFTLIAYCPYMQGHPWRCVVQVAKQW